jgi:hypothetical protein
LIYFYCSTFAGWVRLGNRRAQPFLGLAVIASCCPLHSETFR